MNFSVLKYPLSFINKMIKNKDKIVIKIQMKINYGTFTRPVNKLCSSFTIAQQFLIYHTKFVFDALQQVGFVYYFIQFHLVTNTFHNCTLQDSSPMLYAVMLLIRVSVRFFISCTTYDDCLTFIDWRSFEPISHYAHSLTIRNEGCII